VKLLLLSNKAPYPPNDGSSIAIYNMAQGLVDAGAEVYLLTINTLKHFKPDDEVPIEFKKNTHYQSVKIDTSITLGGTLKNLVSNDSFFVSRFFSNEFKSKLIETLKQNTFDIIQLEGLFMGVYMDVIRQYSKAKLVLRTHNVEHFIWERHIANEKNYFKKHYLHLQNKRLKHFELAALKKADGIVSISESDTAFFKTLNFSKPLTTSITGVNVKAYNLPNTVDENSMFIFSSMDWLPNQEAVNWFLDACWYEVKKELPSMRLIIAGRNMPQHYFNLKDERITILNNVKDASQIYQHYHIMLVPLLSGSGLRIKLIEGLSYGKAIVSTSMGAQGIALETNKDCVLADTATDFVNAIIHLTKNKSFGKQLQENAKAFANEHFDNIKISEHLLNTYKNWFKC
jgi:polysaccharide biosynthesis protein PslH